jgi:hypothetical protein
MTKKDEQVLLIFERKIFRRIYGPKYENGEWKSRMNRELEEMKEGESSFLPSVDNNNNIIIIIIIISNLIYKTLFMCHHCERNFYTGHP